MQIHLQYGIRVGTAAVVLPSVNKTNSPLPILLGLRLNTPLLRI
jgi:hypothetical protein